MTRCAETWSFPMDMNVWDWICNVWDVSRIVCTGLPAADGQSAAAPHAGQLTLGRDMALPPSPGLGKIRPATTTHGPLSG